MASCNALVIVIVIISFEQLEKHFFKLVNFLKICNIRGLIQPQKLNEDCHSLIKSNMTLLLTIRNKNISRRPIIVA